MLSRSPSSSLSPLAFSFFNGEVGTTQ
uniref:Uncharacterized protein n=1 Tax=Arundo donax TaxID=35708 RepID=A0A0A9C238_ARUDO